MSESARREGDRESFAAKLRRLVASVRREDGRKHSNQEMATALGVSPEYVDELLTGGAEPSYSLVLRVAEFFFGEPDLEYFGDTERSRELNRQYEILARLGEQDTGLPRTRPGELSVEKLQRVMEFIASQSREDPDDPTSP